MRPDDVGLGGFDSHTLPPAGRPPRRTAALGAGARKAAWRLAVLVICAAGTAFAQKPDSVRAIKPDSVGFSATVTDTVHTPPASKRVLKPFLLPPISARRAFLYSALIPGWGQAAFDRKVAGATFFIVEAVSWALLRRSANDEHIAKAFVGDSVPQTYTIDPTTGLAQRDGSGNPVVATWAQTSYTPNLIRARALHVEDWVAVILFNHLISGADAFVAANLWDLPQHLGMRVSPLPGGGARMSFTLGFR